jgi:hypothetical protein
LLPAANRLLDALAVSPVTVLVVGALVVLAPAVRRLVEQSFAGAVPPLFATFGIGGLYDLGFLALGLLALGALVRRLYRCWAPVTELLTAYVTDALGGARTDAAESR